MSMSDPIADMLTRIRNGQRANKVSVSFSASKKKAAILDVLKDEGYIAGYETTADAKPVTSAHNASIPRAFCRFLAALNRFQSLRFDFLNSSKVINICFLFFSFFYLLIITTEIYRNILTNPDHCLCQRTSLDNKLRCMSSIM